MMAIIMATTVHTLASVIIITAAAIYLFTAYKYYSAVHRYRVVKKKWRKRRWWMLSIHQNRTRESMTNQLAELLKEPSGEFNNFVRMSFHDFEYIIHKISPFVSKQDTDWRDSIPVKIRLAVTLRFLATGDSYRSLHFLFKISSQIISKIIPEVCLAINNVFKDFVKLPTTTEEWISISKKFKFPHCLGALDGKHITILPPANSASAYYNYKGSFSIVLLALVDHDYCFMFTDIGSQGRISDGGVFNQSILKEKIFTNNINLPPSDILPDSDINVPYVFLSDGAFALSTHIMKPFSGDYTVDTPQQIFNQHLSSSRVIVENTFGIMSSIFRIFKKAIPLDIVKASIITMTCILLHNFLRKSKTSRNVYTPLGSFDIYKNGELIQPGSWRNDNNGNNFLPMENLARRAPNNAFEIRINFMNYLYALSTLK